MMDTMLQWACLQADNLWFPTILYLEMERFIMVEEHLEAPASGQAASWFEQRKDPELRKRQDANLFQTITLVLLPFVWAGFIYSLFTGNEGNMNSYSLMILFFSMLNADVLIKGEKLSNKVLNVLAKANCVLFFVWALANIVYLLVK